MRAIKLLFLLSVFTLPVLVFYSCESDPITSVNQDNIYQIYDARYNADSNWTYARATFRLNNANGSYITLTGATSGVTFNGNSMTEISIFGVVYYQYGVGGFQNPYQYVYTDANSNTFSNSTSLSSMAISFQSPPTVVMQSSGTTFNFTSSVNSGERVTLNIYNASNDSLVLPRVNQTNGSNSFSITSNDLSPLTTGNYYAQLLRQDQIGLSQQNSVGGVMNRTYVSTKAAFTLTP